MSKREELELLAEWLGIKGTYLKFWGDEGINRGGIDEKLWNPLTNDTDFLNMVAGRVHIVWGNYSLRAWIKTDGESPVVEESYADHNNDKVAAMKHAAYQVCLMAAREWRESKCAI